MLALVVALIVLSVVLPTLAFARVLRRSTRDAASTQAAYAERGGGIRVSDITRAFTTAPVEGATEVVRDAWWDVATFGVGMLAGAAASVIPLFVDLVPRVHDLRRRQAS